MRRRELNRRKFLAGLGLGAAGACFLPHIYPTRAATSGFPKRLILMFSPNGVIYDAWVKPGATETSFELGPSLLPLAPFKDKLILLDGINNEVARDSIGSNHQTGAGCFLTAATLLNGDFGGGGGETSGFASGISIDQLIANELNPNTYYKTLELGVRVRGTNNRHYISYAGSNQPLPPAQDPYALFEKLFANIGTPTGTVDPEAERRKRRGASVLDYVRDDIDSVYQKVGDQERERLDAHLQALIELEKHLQGPTVSGVSCSAPELGSPLDPSESTNYPIIGKLQMDILAAAFACDLTRIATLLWSGSTSGQTFPWIGVGGGHHDLSHSAATQKSALIKIDTWYAEQFAYLLSKLNSIPEGDGTVLDNSLILWGNELSDGDTHSLTNMHWVLAGSAGGALNTGRYLKYAGDPHGNLLVSLANLMDVPITTFGKADRCTGALSNLI